MRRMVRLITQKGFSQGMLPLTEVNAFDIRNINVHRHNRVAKGLKYGAFIGLASGALLSAMAGDNSSVGSVFSLSGDYMALLYGLGPVVACGVAGAAIGSMITVSFPIKGDRISFANYRQRLTKYQYTPQK